ncbi:MAG: FAD-dependent oxidoreductase [Gammaproteobacteria bacterium]|nr:FAD-dependent oxidoreductase [Gammaproteobacteria bacterium]
MKACILFLSALSLSGCGKPPFVSQADVIVVGAGIAGLAAAIEASDNGASVIVLDANSVGGGHAVKAGGLAMIDTQLQRSKGIEDSPQQATKDLLAWGEDADKKWVTRYAHESGAEVHDWLVNLGVEFKLVLRTPESDVPRFHFTKGTAVHVVLPMLREALKRPNIVFLWNTGADALLSHNQQFIGVRAKNLRTGGRLQLYGGSIVLATGGFQSNMKMVVDNWNASRSRPEKLLIGSGQFATGDGYQLAADAGAELLRMDDQVTFVNGIPDPRDADQGKGLTVINKQAVIINKNGERFVDESLPSKMLETAVFAEPTGPHWMVFDAKGARKLGVRGAAWLNTNSVTSDIVQNPKLTVTAGDLAQLAVLLNVPDENLKRGIGEYNLAANQPIATPPFYALQLYPLTRKSMGGPAVNEKTQVLDRDGLIIKGLYAAGELTGVAGINGSYGGSGTFLGPAVYMGRIAGRAAAINSGFPMDDPDPNVQSTATLPLDVDGYWHYTVSHDAVRANEIECDTCHLQTPMAEAGSSAMMMTRLDTCTHCH